MQFWCTSALTWKPRPSFIYILWFYRETENYKVSLSKRHGSSYCRPTLAWKSHVTSLAKMVMVKNIPVCDGANGNSITPRPINIFSPSVSHTYAHPKSLISHLAPPTRLSTYVYFPLNRLSLSCYRWTWCAVLKDDERARGGGVPPQESG